MSGARRYREESGTPCIDIGVEGIERLLDQRDPAPFRDRDLDPGLVEYLLDAAEDLGAQPRVRVIFWLTRPGSSSEIQVAYRGHFEDTLRRIGRRTRERVRIGASMLAVGSLLLVLLLSLSQLIQRSFPGSIGSAIAEGLVILSWVVLWRPVEVLLFDWIPARRERSAVEKLLQAGVEVRTGPAPFSPDFRLAQAAGSVQPEPGQPTPSRSSR
jgi:hypothetical protein